MDGRQEINNLKQNRIEALLQENRRLQGFYSFIGNKSYDTTYKYLLFIKDFIIYSEVSDFKDLKFDDFSGYMMKIRTNEDGTPASSSKKILVYSALKKFGKYLVASGQLQSNPMDYIDRPKPIETPETIRKREIGYLDKKEINKYLKTVKTGNSSAIKQKSYHKKWKERDLALILVLLNTGMRRSALMSLNVDSVNFGEKTITVIDKGSRVTTYEVTDDLLETINQWLVRRREILGDIHEDALFISNRKKRISGDNVADIVKKYAVKIEGKNISPHKLRATFGTQILEATNDIYLTQKAMGHNSPVTTERYIRGQKNPTKKTSEIMSKLTIK